MWTGELGDFATAAGDVVTCPLGVWLLMVVVGCRGCSDVLCGITVVNSTRNAGFTADT